VGSVTTNSHAPMVRLKLVAALLPLFFVLLCAENLFSQNTAAITGTVTDPTGGVVPAAQVTITDVETNTSRKIVTDSAGRYSSGPLSVGGYRVQVEAAGFKRLVHEAITLQVQQTAVVDLQLELGQTTEAVTVTAAPPLIRTTDASQGEVIDERRVEDLPLNGRDYLQLSLLSEGAMAPPGQGRSATGENSGTGSRAGGFSAGGTRTIDNNYLLNGFNNNTDDASMDSNQADTVKPSVDAVREFKVQTNGYSAEFGRAGGGVVNLTLKSGTNRLHGTAYEFLRNEKLDARNFFDPASTPPFKRNDYGFSVGGPVIKDKAFFFFAWEKLSRRESSTANNTIPTFNMRTGDFSQVSGTIYDPLSYNPATKTRQPFAGNIIPKDRIDPVAKQLIDFYPTPQNGKLSQNFIFNPPNQEDLGRINTNEDYQLSQNHRISWMFNRQSDFVPAQSTLPPPAFGDNTRVATLTAYNTGLSWVALASPTLVTTTKIGWAYDKYLLAFSPEALAVGNVSAKVGLTTPPNDLPVKYPSMGPSGYSSLGVGNNEPYLSNGQDRQLKNDTSWVIGSHTFTFGIDFQWIQTNNLNARNAGGMFSFSGRYTRDPLTLAGGSSVADFLLGDVDSTTFSTNTRLDERAILLAGYLQDDWRVTPRFTLNLGMRYEYMRPFEDVFDKRANVDLDTDPLNPTLILASQVGQSSFLKADTNNVQPRFGMAYQVMPEKLVLRAGYGIYYPVVRYAPFGDSDSWVVNPPYNVAVSTSSNGITPATLLKLGVPVDSLALQNAQSVSLASQQRDPALGYTQQWNFNVQYQPAQDWMVQVGYFGTKGNHLVNKVDDNYVETLGPGSVNSLRRFKSIAVPLSVPGASGPSSVRVISPIGNITRTEYEGNSIFHSLQAKVEHRFSNGFAVMGSWIWSKGIGDIIGDNGPGQSPGSGYQNPANLRAERGPLDTNLSQRFVVSGIWDLPFGRGRQFGSHLHPVLDTLFGGWSLGGIMTLTTGRPFNVTVNGDPANSGQTNRADVVGDWRAVPGGQSVSEFFNTAAFQRNRPFTYGDLGRNVLVGPDFTDIDCSLSKEATLFAALDQPWKLQFRWEVFNLFNHANFGFPGGTLGTPTFGQLTNANESRKMQAGLKMVF
jgi:Carboxypeptidase regulatory-like domain